MPVDFEDLFKSKNEVINDKRHRLPRIGQVQNLTDFLFALNEKLDWQPLSGTLLVERDGLGYFSDHPVLMYLRPLDLSNFQDQELVKIYFRQVILDEFDCVVAKCNHDGAVTTHPHSKRHLRKYTLENNSADYMK